MLKEHKVVNIALEKLKVHPNNEKYFDDIKGSEYELFKKSIEEEGIITPLTIAPDMTIISGHQRYKAACDLRLVSAPCLINEALTDETQKLKMLLASNFGRFKNNPMKQSRVIVEYEMLCGIKRGNPNLLKTAPTKKQKEIASELGISIDTLKRLKNLQKLAPDIQDKIEKGELNYTTALKVFGTFSYENQKKIISNFVEKDITNVPASVLKRMIEENNYKIEMVQESNIYNSNKKLRSICTHLTKEVAIAADSINEITKRCKGKITKRNREYLTTTLSATKEQISILEESLNNELD